MAIVSHPPVESNDPPAGPETPVTGGVEPFGVRPAALVAALVGGGALWYVLVSLLTRLF